MNLLLDPSVARGYKSQSQIARRITEHWAAQSLYCLACAADVLEPLPSSTAVTDFLCVACSARYQLKSTKGPFGRIASNSAYQKKVDAIKEGRVPHYAFLRYSKVTWSVHDLFVVPGHFFSLDIIAERAALKPTARRSGWVGSSILLYALPVHARVVVVAQGTPRPGTEVRREWSKFAFLGRDERARGGWGAEVLERVEKMRQETYSSVFTLQDFYRRFESELAQHHPENRNVQAKIRQQLQVLRDGGLLSFLGQGRYRLLENQII